MATGDKWAWITAQRILGYDTLRDNVIGFFRDWDKDILASVFRASGYFQEISIVGDGANKIKLTGYPTDGNPSGIDGAGELLDLYARYLDVEDLQFENITGETYHVALKGAYIPTGLSIGQGDGMPQWNTFEEIVGVSSTPASVVDNGNGTLTFVVDTVTEVGVSNAGRKVIVYRTTPTKNAVTEAIAKEECTVTWDGSNNKITTVGDLGLLSGETPVWSDYTVVLVGPHIVRDTDLSADDSYAYIGTVDGNTGAQPSSFDTTLQNVMSVPISDLTQITRYESFPTPDRLKVDVKAVAAEEGENLDQIRVTGWDGGGSSLVVFRVDELGNVTIEGDLEVKGTTTQQDVVQVNADETITENLTCGDEDSDSHLIKGIWTHKNAAETANLLQVHPTNGVGIGTTAHFSGSYSMYVDGDVLFSDDVRFAGNAIPHTAAQDLGESGNKWANLYVSNIYADATSVGGHMNPDTTDVYDLGENTTPLRWRSIYVNHAYIIDPTEALLAIRELDASLNEKNWQVRAAGGDLYFECVNDAETLAASFMQITRSGQNPTSLTMFASIFAGTSGLEIGQSSEPFEFIYGQDWRSARPSVGTSEKNWRQWIQQDSSGDYTGQEVMRFSTSTDAWALGTAFLTIARVVDSTDVDEVVLAREGSIKLTPASGSDLDVVLLGGGNLVVVDHKFTGQDFWNVNVGNNLGTTSYPWVSVYGATYYAQADQPRYRLDDTNTTYGNWQLWIDGVVAKFSCMSDDWSTAYNFITFTRSGETVASEIGLIADVVFTGDVKSNIKPTDPGTYSLGVNNYEWDLLRVNESGVIWRTTDVGLTIHERKFRMIVSNIGNAGVFRIQGIDDNETAQADAIVITKNDTTYTIDDVSIYGDTINLQGPTTVTGNLTATGGLETQNDPVRFRGIDAIGNFEIEGATPTIQFDQDDQANDYKYWDIIVSSGSFQLRSYNQAHSSSETAIQVTKGGTSDYTVDRIAFVCDRITVNSSLTTDGFVIFSDPTDNVLITGNDAALMFRDAGAGSNEKVWSISFDDSSGDLVIGARDDDYTWGTHWVQFHRGTGSGRVDWTPGGGEAGISFLSSLQLESLSTNGETALLFDASGSHTDAQMGIVHQVVSGSPDNMQLQFRIFKNSTWDAVTNWPLSIRSKYNAGDGEWQASGIHAQCHPDQAGHLALVGNMALAIKNDDPGGYGTNHVTLTGVTSTGTPSGTARFMKVYWGTTAYYIRMWPTLT